MNTNQEQHYYSGYNFGNYNQMFQCHNGEEPVQYQCTPQPFQQPQLVGTIDCANIDYNVSPIQNNTSNNQYFNSSNDYACYSTNSYNTYPYNYTTEQNYYSVPPKSATPDKPIMNDSGIETSPAIITLTQSLSSPVNPVQTTSSNDTIKYTTNAVMSKNNLYGFKTNEAEKLKQNMNQDTNKTTESDDNDEFSDEEDVEIKIKENNKNKKSKDDQSLMKPPKPYLEIIADAILSSQVRMMQLHEIYYYMEKKYPYFAQNVNKSWRNSVRHNLSLNECFVKAGRGTNGKGNYWKIHNLCEPDFQRGNFRRKNFKQIIRSSSQQNGNRYEYPSSFNYLTHIPSISNFQISDFISKQSSHTIPNINSWCNISKIV